MLVKKAEAGDGEIRLDGVEDGRMLVEQDSKAAGGNDLGGTTDLALHPSHQPLDHRHIPPEDADVHLVFGGPADDAFIAGGSLDGDPRQLCGCTHERVEREVDAGRNDAALIGSAAVD